MTDEQARQAAGHKIDEYMTRAELLKAHILEQKRRQV
jgi:hypothetical protein